MSSIWIILLDISGSMTEGFSGTLPRDPLAEHGSWNTKLEAAKDLLLKRIERLRVDDIAVFSFADHANKIFHGSRAAFSRASVEIAALQGGGETNLAEALTKVAEDPGFKPYRSRTVLIISDGLANVGDPLAAAKKVIDTYHGARIDTILIDETEEGRRIAEAVSIDGDVIPVFSAPQLSLAVESARASSIRHEISGMVGQRFELESELAVIVNEATPLLLTITSPLDLNASSLRREIVPFLDALEGFQSAFSEAWELPYQVMITSISQASPVTISLKGLRDAVELVLDSVVPWRRENAKLIAEARRRQMELENLKIEESIARERAETEVGLAERKMGLAEKLLNLIDPNQHLSPQRRLRHFHNLIHDINQISETSIEFKVLGLSSDFDELPPSQEDGGLQ
jgi:hypothetical protein